MTNQTYSRAAEYLIACPSVYRPNGVKRLISTPLEALAFYRYGVAQYGDLPASNRAIAAISEAIESLMGSGRMPIGQFVSVLRSLERKTA